MKNKRNQRSLSFWKLWFLLNLLFFTILEVQFAKNASILQNDDPKIELKGFSISEDKKRLYLEIVNAGIETKVFSKDHILHSYCSLQWTLHTPKDDQQSINGEILPLRFSFRTLRVNSSIIATKGNVQFVNRNISISPKSSIRIAIDIPAMIKSVNIEEFFSGANEVGFLENINTADINCSIMLTLPSEKIDSRDIVFYVSKDLRLGSALEIFGDVSSKLQK